MLRLDSNEDSEWGHFIDPSSVKGSKNLFSKKKNKYEPSLEKIEEPIYIPDNVYLDYSLSSLFIYLLESFFQCLG